MSSPQKVFLVLGGVFVLATCWLALDWQPDRQLRRATERLLATIEDHNWSELRDLLADDYRDQWQQDRIVAVQRCSEAAPFLPGLEMTPSNWNIQRTGRQAIVECNISFAVLKTSVGQLAQPHLDQLTSPFRFEWRRESWKPWDWRLYSVSQPELRFSIDSLP